MVIVACKTIINDCNHVSYTAIMISNTENLASINDNQFYYADNLFYIVDKIICIGYSHFLIHCTLVDAECKIAFRTCKHVDVSSSLVYHTCPLV